MKTKERKRPIAVRQGILQKTLDYLYEVVYNPVRSGFVRVADIGVEISKNEVGAIMRYLEENTPMGGLDVEFYRDGTSSPIIWYVEKSDVQGPISYPRLMPDEIDCSELRSRIIGGEDMNTVADDMNINIKRAKRHIHGKCDCVSEEPALRFKRTRGWIPK